MFHGTYLIEWRCWLPFYYMVSETLCQCFESLVKLIRLNKSKILNRKVFWSERNENSNERFIMHKIAGCYILHIWSLVCFYYQQNLQKQSFTNVFQDRCSVFLKITRCLQEFLFNKVAGLQVYRLYYKATPTQLFSCEYFKIFKSSFIIEHLQ